MMGFRGYKKQSWACGLRFVLLFCSFQSKLFNFTVKMAALDINIVGRFGYVPVVFFQLEHQH